MTLGLLCNKNFLYMTKLQYIFKQMTTFHVTEICNVGQSDHISYIIQVLYNLLTQLKVNDFFFCSYNDGLLEVMGLSSSFHIAQLQVGLAQPLRLGQARKVKVSISEEVSG